MRWSFSTLPYLLEPEYTEEEIRQMDENAAATHTSQASGRRRSNETWWCTCGKCQPLPTEKESQCCHDWTISNLRIFLSSLESGFAVDSSIQSGKLWKIIPSRVPVIFTLKMSLCRMCGGPIEFPDAHEHCVLCLGRAHAEAAFEGSGCRACEKLPIKILRARLAVSCNGGLVSPASPPSAAVEPRTGRVQRAPSTDSVEVLPSAQRPRHPHVEDPLSYSEASYRPPLEAREMVLFGYDEDDALQEATDESPAIHIAVNASPVAGAHPPPQHALIPSVLSHLSTFSPTITSLQWI